MALREIFIRAVRNPKAVLTAAVFGLLILFNVSRRPMESETAKGYEAWLQGVEQLAKVTAHDPAAVPDITISLLSTTDDASLNWKFATTRDPSQQALNDRVLRLLELIRASGILSESKESSAELHLIVTEGDRRFEAYFDRADASRNVSLGNFLKLFQIYTSTAAPGSLEKIS